MNPRSLLALCAAISFADAVAAQAVADSTGTGTLAGVVVDAGDFGLANVEVALLETEYIGLTNAQGAFLIPNVPAGRYIARLIIPRDGRAGVYPEMFPIDVQAGEPSGVIVRVSRAAVEDSLIYAAPDEGVSGALETMGIEVNERIQRMVREGMLPDAPTLVTGRVVDGETGRPIANAELALEGTPQRLVSDGQGRFAFGTILPGRYTLTTRMLGYAPRRDELIVLVGDPLDARVELVRDPIALEPIFVEVRSPWLARVGFYERRDDPGNFGHIVTRRDIANRPLASVVDLFHSIPGAHVEYAGIGGRRVQFRRVVGTRGTGGCTPSLYLDGSRMTNDWEYISPDWIEAMEVYVGATRAPIQYSQNPCGAVLIWTRRGGLSG